MNNADGCRCQQCGRLYTLDVMVDNELWNSIKPKDKLPGAGLLCGNCVIQRIERLKGFGVLVISHA